MDTDEWGTPRRWTNDEWQNVTRTETTTGPDWQPIALKLQKRLDRIQEALDEFDHQKREIIIGCGDGNCVVDKPKGQHTNGGCRCTRDFIKMQRFTGYTNNLIKEIDQILAED